MKFHVARLLKDAVGSSRRYEVAEEIGEIDRQIATTGKIEGTAKLMRTNAGILVEASLRLAVTQTCGRCLGALAVPVELHFSEQFVPTIDVATGLPLSAPEDRSEFAIGPDHVLDITEAVRQYTLLALPLAPLCRPDCAGLCPQCGQNRNEARCSCAVAEADVRWSILRGLLASESPPSPAAQHKSRPSGRKKRRTATNSGRDTALNGKKGLD